jgi:hypothetical protein
VLASYAVVSLIIAAIDIALVGFAGIDSWRRLLTSPLYTGFIAGVIGWKMQSLPALLRALAPGAMQRVATVLGTVAGIVLAVVCVARAVRDLRRDQAVTPAHEMSLWALACLATSIASPHLFLYDLVLAIFPCVIALQQRDDARVRALVAILVLVSWTSGLRGIAFGASPWPLRALAGGFSAVPLVWLALRWPSPAPRSSVA